MNKTINFLKSLQKENGAFMGWPDGPEYPEITGYLIPTLLQWGEVDMAARAAMYLVFARNLDGSWNGVDGQPAVFDTAACVEGLRAYQSFGDEQMKFTKIINLSISWIKSQPMKEIYHLRVDGILNRKRTINPMPLLTDELRVHYWAYALEGLFLLGENGYVQEEIESLPRGMQPYRLNRTGSDTCATAQIAKLRLLLGMDAGEEIRALRGLVNHDGSLPHDLVNKKKVAWACKYYLDVEYLIKEAGMDDDLFKVREWEFQEYAIDVEKWAAPNKPVGISGMFRVRNDSEFLYRAVVSHIPYLDEAVICLQPSDKETEDVVKALEQDFPDYVRVVRYPVAPVFITDSEWGQVPENSIRSFVYLSNWSINQCKYSWVARIEADVICCESFGKIRERVLAEPDDKVLYGRVILNVAGENMAMISATVPRNGGWDECVIPNLPEYHFIRKPKYEVLTSPNENINMGWSALHMKRCKSGMPQPWNGETYVPFTKSQVALALAAFNYKNPYPGTDNPEGEECLFNVI